MKKAITALAVSFAISVFGAACLAGEIDQTQVNNCAVFIDEQPVFTYVYNHMAYIPAISLENYGFDVIEEENALILKRNADKNIELAPKSLINRKKDDELFSRTHPVSQGKQSVLLGGNPIPSVNIEGQECIDIGSLSDYAAISWNEGSKVLKLDYKKKEFEIKKSGIAPEVIKYPDAKSAGEDSRYVKTFISANYTGEVRNGKRNGFGVFEIEYVSGMDLSTVKKTEIGYWRDGLADGFQIRESSEVGRRDFMVPEDDRILTQQVVMRVNCKEGERDDGAFLTLYVRYDDLNKDRSRRREGMRYGDGYDSLYWLQHDGGYDGLYRVSEIDESYKYGYVVVSETMWDKGDIAISSEEILAKFDEIRPPLSEAEMKGIDADIRADLPGTLEECYIALENELRSRDVRRIKSGTKDDLIQYHMGLGMRIRNMWMRGREGRAGVVKYFLLNGIRNPDDMSGIIIDGFWHYLNDIDFDIEEAFYQNKKRAVIMHLLDIRLG